MYFLNMYSLFSLKSCIAELQGRENRVSMEQYSVAQFLSKIKIKGIEMHLQKENAHIYPLQALKLLFDNIDYLPDIQPCRNTKILVITIKYPNIAVTIFAAERF